MADSEDRELRKQQPLGFLRSKALIVIAAIAIIAAIVILIITLTKSDGSGDGAPTDDGMRPAVVSIR